MDILNDILGKDVTAMKYGFMKKFLLCGFSGWCMECFWTGLHSVVSQKDPYLYCRTSVWMFPIYGMAVFIHPLSQHMKNYSLVSRGIIYMLLIFAIEFSTGELLKRYHACPWNYSTSRFHFDGVIRLDYAPLWFLVGLFYEQLLGRELPGNRLL